MVTKEWVAVHRKHHQASDTKEDPHSPKIYGIWNILFGGAYYYVKAKDRPEVIKLGVGCPDDWIERNVYSRHSRLGVSLMLVIDVVVFGWVGLAVWLVQMLWIPVWAAGVINGACHWWGYRTTDTKDTSRNLWPWAFWIGGEELHNGHHADGANPKFSRRWWEFDIGWMYICILKFLGLAQLRH
jgi:stearoyl-CoA desaturase (delta-9 desaturase)